MDIKQKLQQISPRTIIIFLVCFVLFVGVAVGVVNWRSQQLAARPVELTVSSPKNNQKTSATQVSVTGKTASGALVSVGGKNIQVDKTGAFSIPVELGTGVNTIEVVATKDGKKENIITLAITRTAAQVTKKATTGTRVIASKKVTKKLTNTGPENFYIPEIMLLSAAGSAWLTSKKKLATTISK